MKKTNLILPVLTRKNAFRCGVVALALVTMTGCKDDAPGIDGPGGNDVTETVEGVDLSVLSNPALAKTYYNSKLLEVVRLMTYLSSPECLKFRLLTNLQQ